MTPAEKALALLRVYCEEWRAIIENDEPINGADAVDWLTQTFYPTAADIVDEAQERIEDIDALRALGERVRSPGSGHYAPVGGDDTIDLLNRVANLLEGK